MNKKIVNILGILVVLGLIGGGVVYIVKTDKLASFLENPEQNQPAEEEPEETPQETPQETLLSKDNFTLTLPAGWEEVVPPAEAGDTILVMAVDGKEEITNETAREAGFMTNLSLKSDDLTRYTQDYSVSEYVEQIKIGLMQVIPDIKFTYSDQRTVGGYEALVLESESTQAEVDFKTLLVFIRDNNDILWAFSFNTLDDSWTKYKNIFYQIAESFKLKYEI